MGYFYIDIWKNYSDVWNQHPRVCRNVKTHLKQTKKIGSKNTLMGVVLGCNFEKQLPYLKSAPFRVLRENNITNVGNKNISLEYFKTKTWKNYHHNWNLHSRICQNVKFCAKNRNPEIWDKKCVIWVFISGLQLWK